MSMDITKKTRRKSHPIWNISREELLSVVQSSSSLSAVLRHFGFTAEGALHKTLKARLANDKIEYAHIIIGAAHNRGKTWTRSMPLEIALKEVFCDNHKYCRNTVRHYLKRYKIVPYKCECGNTGEWRGKPLSLQIDHINGISHDHRIENLRWICPNCHSQTDNYAGKALKRVRPPTVSEQDPNYRNRPRPKQRRYPRPTTEELTALVWSMPLSKIAEKRGVSDGNVIKKWCKQVGIQLPPRGYWIRRSSGLSHEAALQHIPRKQRGTQTVTRFTQTEAADIRIRFANGESQRAIAKSYGTNHNAVQAVLKNPTYGSKYAKERFSSAT